MDFYYIWSLGANPECYFGAFIKLIFEKKEEASESNSHRGIKKKKMNSVSYGCQ